MSRLFTLPGVWAGGPFCLEMDYRGATVAELEAAHNALWDYRYVLGPYERNDVEPAAQTRCRFQPGRTFYGVLVLPPGVVPCSSLAMPGSDDLAAYFSFCVPMSGLNLHYDTGGWPFAQGESLAWRDQVTRCFYYLACHVYERAPFHAAIIEHDADLDHLPPPGAPVPERRWAAIVRVESGSAVPVLYPPTEGPPFTF